MNSAQIIRLPDVLDLPDVDRPRPKSENSPRMPNTQDQGYFAAPDEVTRGNGVSLLHDGKEAYPAMLAAIAAAKKTVHLETYILRADKTGWAFAEALAAKAKEAVQVRVIFDSLGSLDLPAQYIQYLRNHGVMVLEYHPVAPWRQRWVWGRRDHRKILVVDGLVAFTGGINIADDYADPSMGGGGWRDMHARIEGPAAYELDRLFRSTWYRETGKWFGLVNVPDGHAGPCLVRVAANHEFLHRHRIRQAYLHVLRSAKRTVNIANAYFIPDHRIRQMLYAARRRGVDVKLLVPRFSDVPLAQFASRRRFDDFLSKGIRVFEWTGPMLHAKTVIVDSVWTALGSYNMDNRSWHHDLEVNVHVLDRDFGKQMDETFEQDLALSTELNLETWRRRHWQNKVLERLAYLARYWL